MSNAGQSRGVRQIAVTGPRVAALALALALGACSESGKGFDLSLMGDKPAEDESKPPLSALDQAGKDYAKAPDSVEAALAYSEKLKENGRKVEALTVLQKATERNGSDRRLTSAYGRLALEQGKVSLAKGLLEAADDPSNPDWRVVSARGTVLAKEDKHKESIAFFERARILSNDHASVINNLALAYMMSGEAAKAEPLLRKATLDDPQNVKVRQNLALVLNVQGKYDEAKAIAVLDISSDAAAANEALMRTIVRSGSESPAATATATAEPEVVPVAAPAAPTRTTLPRGSVMETSSTY